MDRRLIVESGPEEGGAIRRALLEELEIGLSTRELDGAGVEEDGVPRMGDDRPGDLHDGAGYDRGYGAILASRCLTPPSPSSAAPAPTSRP